jgi:basic amino acid/polyamine antiporter, APA family
MIERQRDAGLVRAIGTWGLAANLVSMIVGAGIFVVPGALAACIGPYAPLAFVVCAVAVGAVAICFAEGGSRLPTSGGAYGYIELAFGPRMGYVAGTMLWLCCVLSCGGVAAALGDAGASLAPAAYKGLVRAAVVVFTVGGIALLNVGGVRRGARLVNFATLIKLAPLAVFIAVGVFAVHRGNFAVAAAPSTRGLGRGVILAFFALVGMESSLSASGEVSNPARSIPRALGLAIGGTTLLYIAIQLVAQGILGASLAGSTTPLVDAMARVSPALRALMLAGAAVSMFGWLSSDILGSPRMLFAFGQDGLLPRVLGRVHGRNHSPYVAILAYAGLAMGFALTGTFAELAVVSTLFVAVYYAAGCAAAWQLARRGVAEAGEPLNFRWLGTAMVVGIMSMAAMIALASREEILGVAVAVGASFVIYEMIERSRRGKNAVETPAHS